MLKNITTGADPEVFFHNDEGFLSAEGLVGGTKEQPKVIFEGEDEGYAVQEDNVMAEFCIPPAKTEDEFVESNLRVLDYLSDVAELNGAVVSISPSAKFDEHFLQTAQAATFGCDPDYGAYIQDLNPIIDDIEGNYRFAGGHIHIGYDDPDFEEGVKLIKAMDIFLGLPSVWLDKDKKRKKYYGTAGRFRIKKYGVEYRTLSNFWLQSEDKIRWVYRQTQKAIEFVNSGEFDKLSDDTLKKVRNAIDNNAYLVARTQYVRITKNKVKTV